MLNVNLSDLIPGCKHFTWKEALWLPQWNRAADDTDGVTDEHLENIKNTAQWMDQIREYFGKPINVHCWLRPEKYNELVHGAKGSQHMIGHAVDFDVVGMSCDDARQKILDDGKLDEMGLRMEDMPGSNWVHLDDRAPGPGGRYFKP